MSTPRRGRVRAPRFDGRRWLNTDRDLTLADLRGKVVLLDFWTGCCVNCLHVLEELRPLEAEFADALVVVGVHSPKFPHEAEPATLDAAVERYGVHHPVLDDAQLRTWDAYAARAWPTLVVVDPEGYVVASLSGEGHAGALRDLVGGLVAEHGAAGTLRRGEAPATVRPPAASALRFPSRVLALPGGTVLVADTAHHQLVELLDDLRTEVRRFGSGARGSLDGSASTSTFVEPQGLALLPADVAAAVGYDLVVADAAGHVLRGVSSATGEVRTVAGTGRPLRRREGGGVAREQDLSSPWDVVWFDGQVVVAMAGVHQLWAFDPVAQVVRVLAGTTAEGIGDGPAEGAWFAQTSGLAVQETPEGELLWFVDAETSALRTLRRNGIPDRRIPVVVDDRMANVAPVAGAGYEVTTRVGQGLFEFGFLDGPAARALLQHPSGLTVAADGSVLVADTYNGAVRRFDPVTGEVSTVLRDLVDPVDVLVDGDTLVVVEGSAHRLTRELAPARLRADDPSHRVRCPPTDLAPGPVELTVQIAPPAGQRLDDRWGDPTRLDVTATPPELLLEGSGEAEGLRRNLVLSGAGVLHVSARIASCDSRDEVHGHGEGDEHGDAEGPGTGACHLHRRHWDVPVRPVAGGPTELRLSSRAT